MARIIGIDYGRARVGVAQSDPLGIFASPVETVPSAKIIEYLQKYSESETIVRFVVGYRLDLQVAGYEEYTLYLLRRELLAVGIGVEDCRYRLYQIKKPETVYFIAVNVALCKLLKRTVACKERNENEETDEVSAECQVLVACCLVLGGVRPFVAFLPRSAA